VTVPSRGIVERLDVLRDRFAGDQAILVYLFLDVLFLQSAKERFRKRYCPNNFLGGSCLGLTHWFYRTAANHRFRIESPGNSPELGHFFYGIRSTNLTVRALPIKC
jgi:hypothetical protein